MQNLSNGIIDQLNYLLTITNNAKNGYTLAAEKEEDDTIKKSFEYFSTEHSIYSNELKELINSLGGKVADVFAPGDVTNRSWMEVGAVAGDENKEPVINACINGEKALIKAYKKMLADEQVDENVKKVLLRHLNAFEYTIRKITAHLTPTM